MAEPLQKDNKKRVTRGRPMKTTANFRLMALLLAFLPAGPAMAVSEPPPPLVDPTSEFAPPPFEIIGPEDLNDAIEKAKSIDHPDYKERLRYRRSTHISFPLSRIDNPDDMSQASIAGVLGLTAGAPEAGLPPRVIVPDAHAAPQPAGAGAGDPPRQPPPTLVQGETRGWTNLSVMSH